MVLSVSVTARLFNVTLPAFKCQSHRSNHLPHSIPDPNPLTPPRRHQDRAGCRLSFADSSSSHVESLPHLSAPNTWHAQGTLHIAESDTRPSKNGRSMPHRLCTFRISFPFLAKRRFPNTELPNFPICSRKRIQLSHHSASVTFYFVFACLLAFSCSVIRYPLAPSLCMCYREQLPGSSLGTRGGFRVLRTYGILARDASCCCER